MAKNILKEDDNRLAPLDYSDLLDKIITVLKDPKNNPFKLNKNKNQLVIDVDEIAFNIASQRVANPLGNGANIAKAATVNFSNKKSFIDPIKEIKYCLKKYIESALKQSGKDSSIENYVTSLATELKNFHGETKGLNFTYPFNQHHSGLQKQRLSFQPKGANIHPLLRFHKLTITVENAYEFPQYLKDSLRNFIEFNFNDETEKNKEELGDILENSMDSGNKKSDFNNLKQLIESETLGQLQKQAKLLYLKFLKDHIGQHQDLIYLEILIKRLQRIEAYINDPDKQDGYYEVNYAGVSVNYRELFNRAEAFDMLPIIPIICGYLGEIRDERQRRYHFVFGLKLKLGGKVQKAGGKTSFEYHLNFLNSESEEHKEGLKDFYKKKFFVEKVLGITLLYYFVFAGNNPSAEDYTPESDLNYDPASTFEEKVLSVLKQSDDSRIQRRLGSIKLGLETYKVNEKIEKLKSLLLRVIGQTNILQSRTYPVHISIKQGILERDYTTIDNNSSFFKSVLKNNLKAALQYISIGEANVDHTSLCSIPASIHISDIQYFATGDSQIFSLEYDINNQDFLPILLVPKEKLCREIYSQQFNHQNLIVFAYNYQRLKEQIFTTEETPKTFIYQLTFTLLAYISLKVLLDPIEHRLFIPILRLHLAEKQDPSAEEVFMRSTFFVISHLLNEKHRSNSQGFYIKNINPYKINNGLSSLYSILPKTFKFNNTSPSAEINKLAIVIVSSRESDRNKYNEYKVSNLFGEVVGITRQSDGIDTTIKLNLLGSFSANYNSQQIHTHPDVLIEEFNKLYQQGFRHFLYIAKSPYSTTVNITATEEDKNLYFMSQSIIRALKGNREDMKIYPIFFDQYYVVKFIDPKVNSLYIQDTLELTNIVKDPNKKSVVFFNLFNGITVGNEDRYYNGVISYTTLLNVYEGILDEKDIYLGLIDDSPTKNDLLQYLTLYHFSKYEASPTKKRNISLKLDPYQDMIGDESVGKLSIFQHMDGKVNFNSLAFLTEVRKALYWQPESETVQPENEEK